MISMVKRLGLSNQPQALKSLNLFLHQISKKDLLELGFSSIILSPLQHLITPRGQEFPSATFSTALMRYSPHTL